MNLQQLGRAILALTLSAMGCSVNAALITFAESACAPPSAENNLWW
jgi:hypothetical protein